jgi:hypothetical protein
LSVAVLVCGFPPQKTGGKQFSWSLMRRLSETFTGKSNRKGVWHEKVIIVLGQGDGYHVALQGHTSVWGSGKTIDEAIGNMISAHPEVFQITLRIK